MREVTPIFIVGAKRYPLLVTVIGMFFIGSNTVAETNFLSRDPVSAAIEAQQKALKRFSITGSARTVKEKFESVARYYGFPANTLMSAAIEYGGTEDDQLDTAIDLGEKLSLRYMSGESMSSLLEGYFGSKEISDRVIERSYIIAQRMYPKKN